LSVSKTTCASKPALYNYFANYSQRNSSNGDAEEDDDALDDWIESLCTSVVDDNEIDYQLPFENDATTLWTRPSNVSDAIRDAFRRGSPTKDTTQWAIRAYKLLVEQGRVFQQTSISYNVDRTIRIVATSFFMGRNLTITNVSDLKYRFAYRIRIENLKPSESIQLLGRSWTIRDAQGVESARVHAPTSGAVGRLPVLSTNQAFEYSSSCELATSVGTMQGSFYFVTVLPGTSSALISMEIEALKRPKDWFQVQVDAFPLVARE
jgi:uncharacterized protein affecting Mg2+/Co2+ transport